MNTIVWVIRAYNGTGGYNYDVGSIRVNSDEVDETIDFIKKSVHNESSVSFKVLN